MKRLTMLLATTALTVAVFAMPEVASAKEERCSIAWSHYTGWEPLGWIQDSGVAEKWGKKYNVDLTFTLINDYVESVNQYAAGGFDGVAVTNMDALTIPAAGGVDTTFVVVGDFSNGNDGILIYGKPGLTAKDLKGKRILLVELSVSHYLLVRALESVGLSERDVTIVNTSDADLGGLIASSKPGDAFVTWNPILLAGRNVPNMQLVFDSSKIPGEIKDGVALRTDASDACKRAVAGAWYEAMSVMGGVGPETDAMLAALGAQAGGNEAEFRAQLKTTRMFYAPQDAAAFAASDELKKTMAFVAKFSFDHGLYGDGKKDEKAIGIAYPNGNIWGDTDNVKLRFDTRYMMEAAEGKL